MKKTAYPVAALVLQAILGNFTAIGSTWFPPELLNGGTEADLSVFTGEGQQAPGVYTVDVYLNGERIFHEELFFRRATGEDPEADNTGKVVRDRTGLKACLTRQHLKQLEIPTPATPSGTACLSLAQLIPGAFTVFDFSRMRLNVSIPQAALKRRVKGEISPERWDDGITAFLLNWRADGSHSYGGEGKRSSSFFSLNSGFNTGPWRLRDERTWRHEESRHRSSSEWQHVSSYIERAIAPLRSQLLIGDSRTRDSLFDSLGFRGVQLSTDADMYPDSIRYFAPVIRGTAYSNAQVIVRQRGYIVYQTAVPPGDFILDDLSVAGGGDLSVTVEEADGTARTFTVPYTTLPVLVREGHQRYSLTAGRLQSASERYDHPFFLQGSLKKGLPAGVTAYGGTQVSGKYLSALAGVGASLGVIGGLSADLIYARSTLADDSRYFGHSLRLLYAKTFESTGTSLDLAGYRYSSEGFHSLEETALKNMKGWLYPREEQGFSGYYNLQRTKKQRIDSSVTQSLGRLGSLWLNGRRLSYRGGHGSDLALTAGFNSSVGRVSYGASYGWQQGGDRQRTDRQVSFWMGVPLDGLMSSRGARQVQASFSASQDGSGRANLRAGLSGSTLLDDSLSWRLSMGGNREGGRTGDADVNLTGRYGQVRLGYSQAPGYRTLSYGGSGAVVLHGEGITAGQYLGESSVLLIAPEAGGARVENERGVRLNSRGQALKPAISAWRENRISLDVSGLEDDVDATRAMIKKVPTRGAIVRAEFSASRGKRVLMTLYYRGKPVPFGSMVSAGKNSGIVGDGGQVYLRLPPAGTLRVQWGTTADQQCTVNYRLNAPDKRQPVIRIKETCHKTEEKAVNQSVNY
ncbi:fimbrial biogenesis outer membrane usher protein [Salmonella enterica subsp. salamae]|nr:fimbrial biogenesis outer membrane usher protein [Salmonella enterica subsp. salamae]ECG1232583.1 fimbrial biogenesis outer membrane usher protein [Salmonella enterica subsp. salamae]ECI3324069.1 fimbrial biogenesis outer membrane usher protein [Salmonella enterica subsp. salamae]